MRNFLKNKSVVFAISLILGGFVAILMAFALFYIIAILIGDFHSSWMIFNLLISAVLLITIFAIASKKIHIHLVKFLVNKIE